MGWLAGGGSGIGRPGASRATFSYKKAPVEGNVVKGIRGDLGFWVWGGAGNPGDVQELTHGSYPLWGSP